MIILSTQVRSCLPIIALFSSLLVLGGCAKGLFDVTSPRGVGVNCVDDSEFCLTERRQALSEIMADKSMNWVSEKSRRHDPMPPVCACSRSSSANASSTAASCGSAI